MSVIYIEALAALAKPKKDKTGMKSKLVEFPLAVFDRLEIDAERCRRNLNKHIEAILVAYLDLEDVELNDVSKVRGKMTASSELDTLNRNLAARKLPYTEIEANPAEVNKKNDAA